MSASELGETATEVEDSLEQVLELTSKWNAILLLDECDMFLEARSAADIPRNRLVSGEFLTFPLNRTKFLLTQSILTNAHSHSLFKAARVLSRRNVPYKQPYQRLRHSVRVANTPYHTLPGPRCTEQTPRMEDLCTDGGCGESVER